MVNLNKKSSDHSSHSGRPRTRKQQISFEDVVQESVERSPKQLLRRRSQSLNLNMSTGRKVIVTDLKKYPYRIKTKQKASVANKQDIAEKMAEKIEKNQKI